MALLLTLHQSAHGFLPSLWPLQHLLSLFHATTPSLSLWGRRHEFPLSLKQDQIQSRRALGASMLRARPNLQLNSDPACIAFRSLSTFRYLSFAHRLGAGGAG